jgi:hypothetical protein
MKMKRKAILLKYGLNDYELFTSGKDLGLVKCFLKSAQGGYFSDEEIVEYISSEIEKDFLVTLIESVEYSFIYFSGHSFFFERLVHIQLINNEFIKESELIRPNKKQWIFLDCCRTSQESFQSPDFVIARHMNLFVPGNDIAREKWKKNISSFDSFYILYYTTKLGCYSYNNNDGGFGTQLFFMKLMENNRIKLSIKELMLIINQETIQHSDIITGNIDESNFLVNNMFENQIL